MQISARNQLKGKVILIEPGQVMAKVKTDIGNGNIITALISKESVAELNLKVGDEVISIIKSTEIMVAKP